MDLSEILLSIVAAAATLTPLILGLLKYFGDKKNAPEPIVPTAAPVATLGDTVDFESVAVSSLKGQIELLLESHRDTNRRLTAAEAQRDEAYAALRAAGLPHP